MFNSQTNFQEDCCRVVMGYVQKRIGLYAWSLLFILSLIWGSSFILIKKALLALRPVELAGIRMVISSVAFLPMAYYHRKKIDLSMWDKFLLVGLAGTGVPAFLFSYGQKGVDSSLAGLLNSLTPIFTLLLSIFIFRQKSSLFKTIGVILGFVGVGLILIMQGLKVQINTLPYAMLIIAATFCYGLSVNTVHRFFRKTHPIVISSVSFAFLGPAMLLFLLFEGGIFNILERDNAYVSIGAVFILALLGTVFASIIFYDLIQKTNPVFGSSVAYIMPVMAMVWGVIDGESVMWFHLLGAVIILLGIYLVRKE